MDKIKINLLPPEIREFAKKRNQKALLVKVSILMLILLVIGTSLLLSVVVFQRGTISDLDGSIKQLEVKITTLKQKEVILSVLKNRFTNISKLENTPAKQAETFNLITAIVPQGVDIISLTLDKPESLLLSAETTDMNLLQELFNNLTDPKVHEGKIIAATIESINKRANNKVHFDLTIKLK